MIKIRHLESKHGRRVGSHETTWMNKKLTLNSMSMAAGEEETEVSKEWEVSYETSATQT